MKVDFHIHTSADPKDYIDFNNEELIDRASSLGFDAVAITNHDAVTFSPELEQYAADRGVLLIPGAELTLSGKHVLVINPEPGTESGLRTLEDLAKIRSSRNLIIAPHPFYPGLKCLRSKLEKYASLFDAVEFSFFYNHLIDRNKKALRTAKEFGKPLVGTSDCHNLWQFGFTYSLVEAEKNVPSIIAAVKAGKVSVATTPLPLPTMMRVAANWFLNDRLHIHYKFGGGKSLPDKEENLIEISGPKSAPR